MTRKPWLIQRLLKPTEGNKRSSVFSFGGGFKNGGLSDEAMKILNEVFTFDYMGAAEFEFGALPKALNEIVKNADMYVSDKITLDLSKAKLYGSQKDLLKLRKNKKFDVWIFCKKDDVKDVKKLLSELAVDDGRVRLKENPHLVSSQLEPPQYHTPFGWLELDNGFFFFTDKKMFDKTVSIFKPVETP